MPTSQQSVVAEKFRTNDLVLATLLTMDEHEARHELEVQQRGNNSRHRHCVWVFDVPEDEEDREEFFTVIDDFMEDRCAVEPREFARVWADTRRQMFQFLGPDGRR